MPETKEYDASTIVVTVDGTEVADLDSVGYDSSKTHEIQKTLDDTHIWVIGIGEYSGTVAVKATSESISQMQTLHDEDTSFNISIQYAENEPRDSSQFIDAKLLDWAPGDYELEGMPVYEGSWEAPRVEHS
jgi:phage terminase large subunit-like protein